MVKTNFLEFRELEISIGDPEYFQKWLDFFSEIESQTPKFARDQKQILDNVYVTFKE